MAARLVTGILLAAAAIGITVFAPPYWTWIMVMVFGITVADEYARITLGAHRKKERVACAVVVAAMSAIGWLSPEHLMAFLVVFPPILLSIVLFSPEPVDELGPRAGLLVGGAAYLGLAMLALTLLVADPAAGPHFVIALFGAVFGGDTGAFFAGKFLGKAKLYEKISPKKTWAGSFGGAAASIGLFLLFVHLMDLDVGLGHGVAIGLGAGLSGQVGDLAESMFKRAYGVKDSGSILPGHGGAWDRIDGILFAAPYAYAYLSLI